MQHISGISATTTPLKQPIMKITAKNFWGKKNMHANKIPFAINTWVVDVYASRLQITFYKHIANQVYRRSLHRCVIESTYTNEKLKAFANNSIIHTIVNIRLCMRAATSTHLCIRHTHCSLWSPTRISQPMVSGGWRNISGILRLWSSLSRKLSVGRD